ncbi:MAG: EamA family transporter [Longimicrobiales bacterium]
MRVNPPKSLWLALMATFWWGLWAFLVKLASNHLDPFQVQVLFVFGMMPIITLALARARLAVKTDRLGIFYGVLNGVLATLGMLAFNAAMEQGRASVVGPVTALFPMVTVVGSMLLLKERLNRVQRAGICFALAAILLFA